MKKIIPIIIILFLLVGTVIALTIEEDVNIFGNLYVMGSITAMLPSVFTEIMTEHIYTYNLHVWDYGDEEFKNCYLYYGEWRCR